MQIIPRGDGKYLVRVYIGRDMQGKRKYHSEIVNGTISQAKLRGRQIEHGKDTQAFVQPSKQTVGAFLTHWLDTKQDIGTGARTCYAQHLAHHIIPALGARQLGKLTPQHIREFYGSLSSDRQLAPRTVRLTHCVLHGGLQQAVDDGLLLRNPCDLAKAALPKKPQRGAGDALTLEQTALIIDRTKAQRWGILWRLLLTTGLRPQEAHVLKWSDLEVQDGVTSLIVQRALHVMERGRVVLSDEMKTVSSRRRIVLSMKTAQALHEHRQTQRRDILQAGPRYTRNDYIIALSDGRFMHPCTGRYHWKQALKMCGLSATYRLYDTRHTHLTHALGVAHPRAVSDRGGHADPHTLLNTYAHTLPSIAAELPEAIERQLDDALLRVSDERRAGHPARLLPTAPPRPLASGL